MDNPGMAPSDRRGPRRGSSPAKVRSGASADGSSASSILTRPCTAPGPPVLSASDADPADLADSDPGDADRGRRESADAATGDEGLPGPHGAEDANVQGGHEEGLDEDEDDFFVAADDAEAWGWALRPAEALLLYESDDDDDHGNNHDVGAYPELRDGIADYGQYLRDEEYAISDTEDEPFVLHNGAWYRVEDEAAAGNERTGSGREATLAGDDETTRDRVWPVASSPSSGRDNILVVEHTPTPSQESWRSAGPRGSASPPPDHGRHRGAFHWTPPVSARESRVASAASSAPPSPHATPGTPPTAPGLAGDDVVPGGAEPVERSRVSWAALGVFVFALVLSFLLGAATPVHPTGDATAPSPKPGGEGEGFFPPFYARPGPTHYGVLGVPVDATDAQIRARYRALVRAHHPDKLGVAPPDPGRRAALEAEANARVRALHAAYQGLLGITRCHYDYFDVYATTTRAYLECKMRWWAEDAKRDAEQGEEADLEVVMEDEVDVGAEGGEEEDPFHATVPERVAGLLRPVAKRAAEVAVTGHGWWQSWSLEALLSKLASAIGVVARATSWLCTLPGANRGRRGGET